MSDNFKAIVSTAYLPPLDYFRVIRRFPLWEIEQFENYQKQSYRSRCHIYSANGLLPLIIPVDRSSGLSVPVKEIRIDNSKEWQKQHWRAIVSAYNSTPYFEHYSDDLEPFYTKRFNFLFDFNTELLRQLMSMLGIRHEIKFTNSFRHDFSDCTGPNYCDFRNTIHPKRILSQNQKELISTPADLKGYNSYHQLFSEKFGFIDGLSIIDLLFNEGTL
ncbi:MAG: WbqC family protein [Bacteroidales bacterium]